MMATLTSNPFGTSITADDIVDALSFFESWEDRYKYIIDLGKELPAMPDEKKDDMHLVRGCQSQVWIDHQKHGEILVSEYVFARIEWSHRVSID